MLSTKTNGGVLLKNKLILARLDLFELLLRLLLLPCYHVTLLIFLIGLVSPFIWLAGYLESKSPTLSLFMNDDVRLPQAAPSTSQTSTSKTSFLPTINHQLVNNVHNTFPHQIAAGTSNLNSGANLCLNEAMTVSDQPSCLVSNPSAMPRLSSLQTTAHYFNPLLNLAIHQDAQLDHLLSSQRNFQLLNALLQSSQFPGVSNVQ